MIRPTQSQDDRYRFDVKVTHRLGSVDLARLLAIRATNRPRTDLLVKLSRMGDPMRRISKKSIEDLLTAGLWDEGVLAYAPETDKLAEEYNPHEAYAIAVWAAHQVRVNFPELDDADLARWLADYPDPEAADAA